MRNWYTSTRSPINCYNICNIAKYVDRCWNSKYRGIGFEQPCVAQFSDSSVWGSPNHCSPLIHSQDCFDSEKISDYKDRHDCSCADTSLNKSILQYFYKNCRKHKHWWQDKSDWGKCIEGVWKRRMTYVLFCTHSINTNHLQSDIL